MADVDRAGVGCGGDGCDELCIVIFEEFLLTTLTYLVTRELASQLTRELARLDGYELRGFLGLSVRRLS